MARSQILYSPRSELEGRCTGCRLCELICSLSHVGVFNPDRARVRVVSFDGGLDIPVTCTQCGLCLDKCPLGLIKLDDGTGAIVIDEQKCTGCRICLEWCPIGVITVDPVSGKALKCDLCGGSPECVKYCPSRVLHLVESSGSKATDARRTGFASALANQELMLVGRSAGASALQSTRKILTKEE
ncbi:4Fe-4S dicluster domain-containing protein [Candidatus Bathyarchaeota archaeon]|nr:4Fe-4S dicluster domain-containing protein [Candidatus Bathyarchaeota archaeon]